MGVQRAWSSRLLLGTLVAGSLGPTACRPEVARSSEVQPSAPPAVVAESSKSPDVVPTEEVQGRLRTVEGQRVLEVWGTPQEMGFAHGALLRTEILEVLEHYALDVISPAQLDAAGVLYGTVAEVSPRLREEAQGIVAGMRSAGGATVDRLGRELRATDLLVVNAMTDLLAIGCSSVSAWGSATRSAEGLDGGPVVVRNLDWSDDPDLLRNQVLLVYRPEDPERQPVVSVAFAGYIGCLSCMNEAGVTALFNMGYGDGAAGVGAAAAGFAPANLLLRDVIERRDVDGDGRSTAADVEAGLRAATHAGSYILHVVEPSPDVGADPARILEIEADGVHLRRARADSPLGASMLAATNHLRGKEGPQACRRYAAIERAARASQRTVQSDALWELGRSLRLPEVVHMMQVEPGNRTIRLWFRGPGQSARVPSDGVVHRWSSLLSVPSDP